MSKWFKPNLLLARSSAGLNEDKDDHSTSENVIESDDIDQPVSFPKDIGHPTSVVSSDFFRLVDPKCVEDLCINSRKIDEVKQWLLKNSGIQAHGRFLLITGPAGSGKTVTIQVLCKQMNISIKEWSNPMTFEYKMYEMNTGITEQFVDFIKQATRCRSFDLYETNDKAVILVDDFPNSILYDTSLFEKVLNFNPVSVTYLQKAIKRFSNIISSDSRIKSQYKFPTKNVIDSIINSSMGDLRNTTSNYYLACVKGVQSITYKKYGNFGDNEDFVKPGIKDKKYQSSSSKSKKSEDELILIKFNKDTNVDIFHALGRVLYAKRNEKTKQLNFDQIEQIVDQFSSQTETFSNSLFNNYLEHFGSFEEVVRGAAGLSFANTMITYWNFSDDFSIYLYMWILCLSLMVENKTAVMKWNPIRIGRNFTPNHSLNISFHQRQLMIYDKIYYDIITKKKKLT